MRGYAFALAIVLGLSSLSFTDPTPKGEYLQKGYYIVVAAYRIGQEKYMEAYVAKLNKSGLHTKYGYDLGRKFYYIYLDYYTDFNESIDQMLKTRKEGGFTDAWVRIMKEGYNPQPIADLNKNQAEAQPDVIAVTEVKAETKSEELVSERMEVKPEEPKEKPVSKDPPPLKEANVLFYTYNPTNSEPIDGEVEIVDGDVARLIQKVKAHEVAILPDPKNKSGKISLIGSSFGFRKVQHDFVPAEITPEKLPEYMEWRDNHYVIKFDLARLHKGDIETLYNVYFFNDAAIMIPESRYELDRLLDFMNSNEQYKIMLHGHTNGNARGKVITVGPSKNFFELTSDVVNGSGSAKELSYQRALVIKEWLISQKISGDRIDIRAWGGTRMIHDKHSNNARRNVRVEVEVLED
ncbi:MAG TPA: OmpA family protein [Cyclobacteriaceae bacterium]|nr:OmpA family protein [Cyclobacteriaceae bacterium]